MAKKKYALLVEDGEVVGVEIDGKRYDDPVLIPGEGDRLRMQHLVASFSDRERMAPSGKPPAFPKYLPLLFLGVAVLMLVIALISGIRAGLALSRERSAPGQVVAMVERRDSDGQPFYYPVVEYALPDGSLREIEVSEGSWPPAYEVGQQVTVAYDPNQPLNSRIQSISSAIGVWTLAIITGFLSAAFFGATLFARWILKQ
jgi:hypothetical protein